MDQGNGQNITNASAHEGARNEPRRDEEFDEQEARGDQEIAGTFGGHGLGGSKRSSPPGRAANSRAGDVRKKPHTRQDERLAPETSQNQANVTAGTLKPRSCKGSTH